MREHVAPFTAPISMSEEFGAGVAWGSAGYFEGPDGT